MNPNSKWRMVAALGENTKSTNVILLNRLLMRRQFTTFIIQTVAKIAWQIAYRFVISFDMRLSTFWRGADLRWNMFTETTTKAHSDYGLVARWYLSRVKFQPSVFDGP